MTAGGMRLQGEVTDFGPSGLARLMRRLAHNALVIGGISMMAVGFLAQMSLLSIAAVSFAVPATASSFFIETVLAKVILGEHISRTRWIGAVIVGIGVALLEF